MSATNGEDAVSLNILGPGLSNALNDDKGVEGKHIRERAGQIEQVLHKRELGQPSRKRSMPFIDVDSRESTEDDDDDENDVDDENDDIDKHGWRLHSIEPKSSLQSSGINAEIVDKPGQKNELNTPAKGMAFPVFIDMSTVPKPTVSKSDELRRLREKNLVKRISLVFEGKSIEPEVKETETNNVVEQPPPEISELSVSFDGLQKKEELHASRKAFVMQCLLIMTIFVAAIYIIRHV